LTGAETAAEVAETATTLAGLERERGMASGALSIIIMLDSGKGVWNIREIITASPRVCSVGLDEGRLCCHLGIAPDAAFDPFVYAKGRVIIEGRAAKRQPVGISHPYGLLPQFDDAEEIHRLALRGKNMGFAGVMCPHPSWVEPCNRALTPTSERLEFYRETRRLFAEAIARGTAAIPYPGTTMMIDVPVDERARLTLALWERCAARDAAKAEALQRAPR
jgi:citrate lyase beta subunit